MMRLENSACAVALALSCLASASAAAQTVSSKVEKPVSPFILCDGRTGHVGLGETIGRLLAITATAGLSEAVTKQDDVTKRIDGSTAAAACETAIALEGNDLRRVQLGMARAIHLMEANRLDDALGVVRSMPAVARDLDSEAGYRRTLLPRSMLIEADILVRQKKPLDAQQAAVRALRVAPYDVALAKRIARYVNLVPVVDADRDAALAQLCRLIPEYAASYARALIASGRLVEGAAVMTAIPAAYAPFAKEFSRAEYDAYAALLYAIEGDPVPSDRLARAAHEELDSLMPTGYAVTNPGIVAAVTEALALRAILIDAANRRGSEARTAFRAHGAWLGIAREVLPAIVEKLRIGAKADELVGPLAETPAEMRNRMTAESVAALASADTIKELYAQTSLYAKAGDYQKASGATWKVGEKPKFLMKRAKDQPPTTDALDNSYNVVGLPAGDALLLHAALIANARGMDRFVLLPNRKLLQVSGVRFGKAGQPDMPDQLALDADRVIADLSPIIPKPVPRT